MKKLRSRKTALALLAALFIAVFAAGICTETGGTASAVAALDDGTTAWLDDVYTVGDTYTLPDSATIKSPSGSMYSATSVVLTDPDGVGHSGDTVVLGKAGVYTLTYRAYDYDGKGGLLIASEKFSCKEPLYSASSAKSSASYAESYLLSEADGITGKGGLALSLFRGDTFTYNETLDLSAATSSDTLISFYINPSDLYNNYDMKQVEIVLTDAYDAGNYVTLILKRAPESSSNATAIYLQSYVTANAADQPMTGLEVNANTSTAATAHLTYEGTEYNLHQNNNYGTKLSNHSFYGGTGSANAGTYLGMTVSFSYDSASNRFYVWTSYNATKYLIADLDDATFFGEELWTGFTNGKANLSVTMSDYRVTSGNIVITEIAGDDLSGTHASDTIAPVIEVGLGEYAEAGLPAARIGDAYPVFPATAYDETDGEVGVTASVWFNYASKDTRTCITLKNGVFIPAYAGTFTIVYTATDRAGNESVCTYDVGAEALEPLSVGYEGGTSVAAGETFTLQNVTVAGGSGNKTLEITATLDSDPSVSYTLTADRADYSFVPLYEGTYTVVISFSDYLGEAEERLSVTVSEGTGAYIANEAVLPRYLVSGATYSLPTLMGYTFSGGLSETECEVAAVGAAVSGGYYTVTAAGGEYVTFVFSLLGESKSYTVPVKDVKSSGAMDMKLYFADSANAVASDGVRTAVTVSYDDASLTASRQRVLISAAGGATESYAAVDFINKVLASALTLNLGIAETDFGRIAIYVTDSADPSLSVKLTFARSGASWDSVTFSVNDGSVYETSYNASSTLILSYDGGSKFVTDGSVSVTASTYLGGGSFAGFPSGYVYLTLQMESISAGGDAAVKVITVNNQTFTALSSDNIAPEVSTVALESGVLSVNSEVTIPAIYACDVLDPCVSVTVSVTSPSGRYAVAADGTVLNGTQDPSRPYTFVLTEYGSWRVAVMATARNSTNVLAASADASFNLSVLDTSSPVVTFGEGVTEAKLGDTVAIAPIYVSDDTSSEEDIAVTIYLMTPSGKIVAFDYETYGSFTANEAGEWRVIVYATDEGNTYGSNVTIVWYTIAVTE